MKYNIDKTEKITKIHHIIITFFYSIDLKIWCKNALKIFSWPLQKIVSLKVTKKFNRRVKYNTVFVFVHDSVFKRLERGDPLKSLERA